MLEAEFVLGLRVASRHPVARSALAWAVGLATIVRIVSGPAPVGQASDAVVAFAGLLAAAAAPPLFVRGGPLEALRWSRGRPLAATLARLAAATTAAVSGAVAAGMVLGSAGSGPVAVIGGAALHALLIGTLAATLAPSAGCAPATVSMVLLVAAGVGMVELGADPSVAWVLPPPGALLTHAVRDGGMGRIALLAGWAGLGLLGVRSLAGHARVARSRAGGPHAGV